MPRRILDCDPRDSHLLMLPEFSAQCSSLLASYDLQKVIHLIFRHCNQESKAILEAMVGKLLSLHLLTVWMRKSGLR